MGKLLSYLFDYDLRWKKNRIKFLIRSTYTKFNNQNIICLNLLGYHTNGLQLFFFRS